MNTTKHPKADANGWIPIHLAVPPDRSRVILTVLADGYTRIATWGEDAIEGKWTHWRPYDLPPPVKEKTQAEIDEKEMKLWLTTQAGSFVCDKCEPHVMQVIWEGALARERARRGRQGEMMTVARHDDLVNEAVRDTAEARAEASRLRRAINSLNNSVESTRFHVVLNEIMAMATESLPSWHQP